MSALLAVPAWPRWWARPFSELRVDVHWPEDRVQAELDAVDQRRSTWLPDCDEPAHWPGMPRSLTVKTRHASGECFVYVLDAITQRLVAYITLRRVTELDRQTGQTFRSPHSRVRASHRRKGITSAVYRWWLDAGQHLMTGARQSPAARGLWLAMSRHYPLTHVLLEGRRVHTLGETPDASTLDRLDVRAVLMGRCVVPASEGALHVGASGPHEGLPTLRA